MSRKTAAASTTPRVTRPRKTPAGAWAAAEPTPDAIARRAYELFERRGRIHGLDWADWLDAERELRSTN